jgi:ABC-type multidrug transport system fused ATPase/permease subunit
MGGDILKVTLRRVLLAPVNTFFDITPVGKILKIFQDEINIFRNHLFDPIKHIFGMLSHVVVVLSTMFLIGFSETMIGMAFMFMLMQMIVPRYNAADNQLHKVGSTLWGPIHSYFYECMRGTTVIRAFG